MAYFSNGIEGEFFESKYCRRCLHYVDDPDAEPCPVWEVHFLWNYDQIGNEDIEGILETLIPREGSDNKQCAMFIERKDGD